MSRCCVRACPYFKKRPGVDNTGIRCHRFPEDPQLRLKWIDWVDRANIAGVIKISKQAGVCSAHFTPKDYSPMSKKLKSDAIPSIAPEMTPEMAFKLGVARSAEDFVRSRESQEENVAYGSQEEMIIIPDTGTVDSVQEANEERKEVPPTADTSTALVQAYSEYSCKPEPSFSVASTGNTPAQRVFVVPVVKIKEGTNITDHDSSTDSCFSDPGENDSEKFNRPSPPQLILCKTAQSIALPLSTEVSRTNDLTNAKATGTSSFRTVYTSNTVTSSTDTNSSTTSLPIFASVTIKDEPSFSQSISASNTSGSFKMLKDTITSEINVDRSPDTSSFSTNNFFLGTPPGQNTSELHAREWFSRSRPNYKRKACVRDLSPSDFSTPEKCKSSLAFIHSTISSYQSTIRVVVQKLRKSQKTIQNLKSLVKAKQKT